MSKSETTYRFQDQAQKEHEPSGGSKPMSTMSSQYLDSQYPDSIGADVLSIALIGPDEERRRAVSGALAECRGSQVREFASYPPALDDVPRLLEQCYDVIIIDLDTNPEYALELVENICAKDSATVMVYSAKADRDLVVRCMRAGAREYLTLPFEQSTVAEALVRAAASIDTAARAAKKTRGRMLVFLGAKGGSGVTTLACNFAVAMAQESGQETLLIDLGLPMGDAALNLGIAAEYSTDNALLDPGRLDSAFLAKLLVKHRSGVSVLAAPSKVPKVQASHEAIEKLMTVARQEFDNVIVDVGSRLDLTSTTLFKEAFTIYLVTQAGISELRNSNRLISQFFADGGPKLEIVINRYEPRSLGVTEEHIAKALTRPVQWKIPDDYSAARQMQNTTTSTTLADSPVSRLIRQMARSVCGLPATPEKKTGFSFRNLSRSIAEKMSSNDAAPSETSIVPKSTPPISTGKPTVTWRTPDPITCGTALDMTQLDATASVPGKFVYTPGAGYVLPIGTHTLWVTFTPEDAADDTKVQAAVSITVTKTAASIKWAAPSVLFCGKALSADQLNATASVPGTFVYTPAEGEVLPVGEHTLSVTFTPQDTVTYGAAQASVTVKVEKATPSIEWAEPAQISCGTALSAAQLNAATSVRGTFVYTPGEGEVLPAGTHTILANFTPADPEQYNPAQATVTVTVVKAIPAIEWHTPDRIIYGTVLSATQLRATSPVPGTFRYVPAEGALLAAGTHTPTVIFKPADMTIYTAAQTAVLLTVDKATPEINWPTPDPIAHGAPLSAALLNATASVPGTFAYTPAAGEVLAAGKHPLSVTFTPFDTANYATAHAEVSLTVTETTPAEITWLAPSAILYGTALSAVQLNATASVQGTFVYAPASGDVLAPGKQTLSVAFTPADTARHAPAQATVALVVEEFPNIASLLGTGAQPIVLPAEIVDENDFAAEKHDGQDGGSTPSRNGAPETRTYKGATYEKGEDGQWHLQQK